MAEKRLTDEVLKFDNTANRRLSPIENAGRVSDLLEIVDSYVQNGSLPMVHDVVYGLRVAGELSGLDPRVISKVLNVAMRYNALVANPGNEITRINFYEGVDLASPKLTNTLHLSGIEYCGGN
jgi:hypothetical protein